VNHSSRSATLLEATCQVNGANPFGCVVDGHILARGAVIATTLQSKDGDERRRDVSWFLILTPDFALRGRRRLFSPTSLTIQPAWNIVTYSRLPYAGVYKS
jgi:hypothetical protein